MIRRFVLSRHEGTSLQESDTAASAVAITLNLKEPGFGG